MLYRAMLVVIFLQVHFVCRAQQNEIDSLENIVKTTPVDTARVWHLNKLVTALRERDNNKALKYAQEARNLAITLDYQRGLALALENLGWIYYRKGEYSESLELSIEALSISESFGDKSAIARCLNSIAAINMEQKQHGLAIQNFKHAYEISKEINDGTSMARSMNNIAFCYLGMKQLDSTRFYGTKGLEISQKYDKPYLVGFALRTLGDVDLADGHYREALVKFNRVISIANTKQNVFLKVSTLHRIGKTYFALNKPEEAIKHLTENVTLSRRYEFRSELERSLKLLSDIYSSQKETAKAFAFQNEYLIVHDSLHEQRSSEQIALMQARFDSEIKEARIKLLTKEGELQQKEINSQRLWMYFTIGSLTLMVILAFALLYSNGLKRRANGVLEIKNKEIEQQALQLKNLNITKDKLFSIISHDLRSPLASLQGLMTLMSMKGVTNEEFAESSRKIRKNLDSVQEDLDNLLVWAQSQLNGLQSNPSPIKIRPIIDEKIHLFSEIAGQKEITITNEIDDSISIVADRNHIGLVIRNLLANAIKFNKPGGSIRFKYKFAGPYAEISVSDSGVGMTKNDLGKLFNAETHFTNPGTQQEKGVGIGLLLTKEFIEKNGGSIWATSEFGKGTTFTFTVRQDLI